VCHQEVCIGGVQHMLVVLLSSTSVPHVLHQHQHEVILHG
jgi:hypothetical protein